MLQQFIKDNRLSTPMQGKEFVNVEGWQYAGSRLGIVPIVETVLNCSTEQETKYMAKVSLLQLSSGLYVGAGFAICSNKEGGRKFNQEFAIASMAQTRATGKAFRNVLAWLLKAAGYEATPAEELDFDATPAAADASTPEPAPNGAASSPTPPPAAPESAPAPELAPVAAPAMQVSRQQPYASAADAVAARNQYLQENGWVMISSLQKALIAEMLKSAAISNSSRNATLLNYLTYSRERANQAIQKLIVAITEKKADLPENFLRKQAAIKEEGEQLLREPARAAAGAELRQFALANTTALGTTETSRLLAICGNSDWSVHQVVNELQEVGRYLASAAAA